MNEVQHRDSWERARTLAWDKTRQPRRSEAPRLTDEEKRKRFEEVARRLGDEINK